MINCAAKSGSEPVSTKDTGATPAYTVEEKPLGTPRPIRVIAIGAGVYARAPEILEYFRNVVRKYELYRYIKLSHRVVNAEWNDDKSIWQLRIEESTTGVIFEDSYDFMISASGILNNWRWPDIPGLHSFQGQLVHSAAWDTNIDWRGKKVAVLGCGSSGVQIVPTMQPEVEHLTTFIRTPTWITAGFAQSKAGPGGANFEFSDEQKKKFQRDPEAYLQYRKDIERELNTRFKFIIKDSPEQAAAVRFSINEMKHKLGEDPPLLKYMIPSFAVGCRRPTPSNGYLESLTKDNVRVVTSNITEIVPDGIKLTTGEVISVDIFVCATGFDISFRPPYPVIGLNGITLAEQWKVKPDKYAVFLGPGAPIGHGSVLPITEHATKYILRMIHKFQTQDIKSVNVSQEAADDFNEHIQEFMKRTAWSTHCRSWFKNGTVDGPIVALHPGSRIHWFHMLNEPRYEDFIWRRQRANRFLYLGNGFSMKEVEGKDTSYYFNNPESGFEFVGTL
ncbi:hypothetical protein PISL3812_05110 [Talaromyces islandicus]|uniref:Sterigmatocystin biosynthesis monooxygenase stcW n=1 Tax=Talaromyces islandicus TaxID=28573 RepID=A0A0U1LXK3_TALIS|nr:hypothetical protein PISL3812_05110 [Talaromyces islandicus]